MSKERDALLRQCKGRRETLTEMVTESWVGADSDNWLENDALDYNLILDRFGRVRGCRVLVASGGPHIVVDTECELIVGTLYGEPSVELALGATVCTLLDIAVTRCVEREGGFVGFSRRALVNHRAWLNEAVSDDE